VAVSRLTAEILPPDFIDKLQPERVAPMALYLVSEQCPVSGNIYNVGMGCFNRAAIVTGPGMVVGAGREIPDPEQVLAQWEMSPVWTAPKNTAMPLNKSETLWPRSPNRPINKRCT